MGLSGFQVAEIAEEKKFDLKAFQFNAAPEQLRAPRVVRIGLLQNQIVLPTTAPYLDQAKARCQYEAIGGRGALCSTLGQNSVWVTDGTLQQRPWMGVASWH